VPVDDVKDLLQGTADRLRLRSAGQFLYHRVQVQNLAVPVGTDDTIADGGWRDAK